MKRKQSHGIFVAKMKRIYIKRMAEAARQAISWLGKVGAATLVLALLGVSAPPQVPDGGTQPAALQRHGTVDA